MPHNQFINCEDVDWGITSSYISNIIKDENTSLYKSRTGHNFKN